MIGTTVSLHELQFHWKRQSLFQYKEHIAPVKEFNSLLNYVFIMGFLYMGEQVQYLMRGINGEKLGLKYLNAGKIVLISSLCRIKCKLFLRIKTHGERDYKKCHWTNHFGYVVCKMMTIFVTRLSCVEVDPFVGNWCKRRQTETSTTKTSTNRNVDTPKRRQTKTSTD